MLDARLSMALNSGGLELPQDGKIAIFNPPRETDLPELPKERVQIIQGFKPDYDAWEARGYDVVQSTSETFAAVIICIPRAKNEARSLIAQACASSDGMVLIDGMKSDGIDSILREVRGRVTVQGPVSKAHGKLFWIDAPAAEFFTDWQEGPSLTEGGFWTAPGVFSAGGVDLASALLVDALPEKLGGEVADLGAGWGFLSAHVLTHPGVKQVHVVEANHMAVECARRNVTDPRAQFHWADATVWDLPHRVDTVVMNPPFHVTRAADPKLGQAFVEAAARVLTTHGQLWMVANRHLPYETELRKCFAEVEEIGGDARFKLFHAARPTRPGKSRRR
ncbi:MAG: class I SAM-dependent methyltransferase [Sulfitobacter sp.]